MLGLMDPKIFEQREEVHQKTNATLENNSEKILQQLMGINEHGSSSAFLEREPKTKRPRTQALPKLLVEELRPGDILTMFDVGDTNRPLQFEVISRAWVDNIVTVKSTENDESIYTISGPDCSGDGMVTLVSQDTLTKTALCINSINRNK